MQLLFDNFVFPVIVKYSSNSRSLIIDSVGQMYSLIKRISEIRPRMYIAHSTLCGFSLQYDLLHRIT